MRAKRTNVRLSEKKYIDIPCVRALRRENRFLSKCKLGYALDDANKWMRETMQMQGKHSRKRRLLLPPALLHRGDPNSDSIFSAPLFSFLLFL